MSFDNCFPFVLLSFGLKKLSAKYFSIFGLENLSGKIFVWDFDSNH